MGNHTIVLAPATVEKQVEKQAGLEAQKGTVAHKANKSAKPIGSIGDEMMASIFGSSMLSGVEADTSIPAIDRTESEAKPSDQAKLFPRRRER